jgi:hypothetical protein
MSSNFNRFLGGSPASVIVKLVFLSLLVGALMALLGLTPTLLIDRVAGFVRALIDLGFDAFGDVALWILYGAVIVVPIWLLSRIFGGRSGG